MWVQRREEVQPGAGGQGNEEKAHAEMLSELILAIWIGRNEKLPKQREPHGQRF